MIVTMTVKELLPLIEQAAKQTNTPTVYFTQTRHTLWTSSLQSRSLHFMEE